jgi:hypothetical protein
MESGKWKERTNAKSILRCSALRSLLSTFNFQFSTLLLILILSSSCAKTKIVPDDKLSQIFRDIYLTNAYNQQHHTPHLDSLNIYEPVFAKYGYTTRDVQFTIGNFAKRKSARLSDVVDTTIDLLDGENRFYQGRIAVYDTIGRIARERYAKTVYSDSLISVRKTADTARLRIVIPLVDKSGTYEVAYDYLIDSVDTNVLRVNHYLLNDHDRQSGNNSRRLRRLEKERVTATFTPNDTHRKLVLDLNGYPDKMTTPGLTITDLTVRHFLSDQVARDSMARSWFDYRAVDTLLYPSRGLPTVDSLGYILLPERQ